MRQQKLIQSPWLLIPYILERTIYRRIMLPPFNPIDTGLPPDYTLPGA